LKDVRGWCSMGAPERRVLAEPDCAVQIVVVEELDKQPTQVVLSPKTIKPLRGGARFSEHSTEGSSPLESGRPARLARILKQNAVAVREKRYSAELGHVGSLRP
jgi:hypothetical protein